MRSFSLAWYLAFKEIWRNKGRYLLVSMVIALITLLVLFIAALGEGLGSGNREFISKLDAQALVFLKKSDYIVSASRLDRNLLTQIRRVEGVEAAGPLAASNTAILLPDGAVLKTALLGVEPGQPGEPTVVQGRQLGTDLAREVILDRNVVLRSKIQLGDRITIRSTQGTQDELYTLTVVGITDKQSYSLVPSLVVPYFTWERVRPKSESEVKNPAYTVNAIAIRLKDPTQLAAVQARMINEVSNIEVADLAKAIQNIPGYSAQQSTLQTQAVFTLLIGVLVIGGFFQIQILQKVGQIGVLKAIGATDPTIGAASILQIVLVTIIGVAIGGGLSFLLSLGFPPTVPIVFDGATSAIAIVALLLIGPLGGIVSVRYAVRIEPLKALRLS
jgi:putative ABC transport system permease protein